MSMNIASVRFGAANYGNKVKMRHDEPFKARHDETGLKARNSEEDGFKHRLNITA